jgi:hypothetical protein
LPVRGARYSAAHGSVIPILRDILAVALMNLFHFSILIYKYVRVLTSLSSPTLVQARSALALFSASVSVSISPALESDLEPLHSLQRFQLRTVISDSVVFHMPPVAHM